MPYDMRLSASLPRHFTSLYRLFLRAASVSVLEQAQAKKNLRLLWRPCFDAAAVNMKKLGDPRCAPEHEKLRMWLDVWEKRVDGTLSMLCNAAQCRGLPHKVTRNLALLAGTHRDIHHDVASVRTSWNPHRESSGAEYEIPAPGSKRYIKQRQRQRLRPVTDEAIDTLSEVVRLAEGKHSITLGRVIPR